jgi:hypothetical protein
LLPYLRLALAVRYGCDAGYGDGGWPTAEEHALTDRIRAHVALPFDLDEVLHSHDPFAAAARCGLGAALYEEPVLTLIRLCAAADEVRPAYEQLGRIRELLDRSPEATAALPVLLAAAGGRPDDCPHATRRRHGEVRPDSGRLLGALAWAACVADDLAALKALGGALIHHGEQRPRDLPTAISDFLRAGLAALAALAGDPGRGEHHRALAGASPEVTALARELWRQLGQLPVGRHDERMSYEWVRTPRW